MTSKQFNFFHERLKTFAQWPANAPVFEKSLVEAGFVYTGERDKVVCFACSLTRENWKEDEDPLEYHSAMKADCPYLEDRRMQMESITTKTPQKKDTVLKTSVSNPAMSEYEKRYRSFGFCPVNKHWPNPEELAKNGFYWIESENLMRCFVCAIAFDSWDTSDQDISKRHRSAAPSCHFVNQQPRDDSPNSNCQGASIPTRVSTDVITSGLNDMAIKENSNNNELNSIQPPSLLLEDSLYSPPHRINGDTQYRMNEQPQRPMNGHPLRPMNGQLQRPIDEHPQFPMNGHPQRPINGHSSNVYQHIPINNRVPFPPDDDLFDSRSSTSSFTMSSVSSCSIVSYTGPARMLAIHPSEFADRAKRLQTFTTWPRDNPIHPVELCNSGFYYLKKDDCVKCFVCYVTLHNWMKGDSAWLEHLKFSPACPLVCEHFATSHNVSPTNRERRQEEHNNINIASPAPNSETRNNPIMNKFLNDINMSRDMPRDDFSSSSASNITPYNFHNTNVAPSRYRDPTRYAAPIPNYPNEIETSHSDITTGSSYNQPTSNPYKRDDHPNVYMENYSKQINQSNIPQRPSVYPTYIRNPLNYPNELYQHPLNYPNELYQQQHRYRNPIEVTRQVRPINAYQSYAQINNQYLNNPYVQPTPPQPSRQVSSRIPSEADESPVNRFETVDSIARYENLPHAGAMHHYENLPHEPADNFPDSVSENSESQSASTPVRRVQRVNENDIDGLLELGYSRNLIEQTVACYKQYSPHNFLTKDQLMLAVDYYREHGDLEGSPFGKKLNVDPSVVDKCEMIVDKAKFVPSPDMDAQKNCCICHDNVIEVTFSPCGHLCVCVSCAFGTKECPLCRRPVENTQRTYFYGN